MPLPRFRRHRQRIGKKSLHPAAVVGICLCAAVVLTLTVGNLLNLWLDDETYRKFTNGDDLPTWEEDDDYTAKVRKINAYPHILGEEIEPVIGAPAVSVALNEQSGALLYSSEVAAYLGIPQNTEVVMRDTVAELSAFVPYISGIYYPQALQQTTSALLYTAATGEASLMREFLYAGGSEILLRGLPLSVERLPDLKLYLDAVKSAAPTDPVGVSVPLDVAKSDDGWEIISTLLQHCDFCALDVSSVTISDPEAQEGDISPAALALLSDCSYLLNQYDMRLLLSPLQAPLLSTVELQSYPNYQLLPLPPKFES